MTNYIYVLKRSGIPFYVGVTSDLNSRLVSHRYIFGEDVEIEKIDEYTGALSTACALEQFWIKRYIENGVALKNKLPVSPTETNCKHCGKVTFQSSGKREKKFCSTSCRVMNNRKNHNISEKANLSVINNQAADTLAEMKKIQSQISSDLFMFGQARLDGKPLVAGITPDTKFSVEPVKRMALKRTPAHWVELRRDCQTADDYAEWLEDLENDTFLTAREKSQIKQTV